MKEIFSREAMLIGKDNVMKLNNATVAVFGVGGVGGYVCEALARSGVGALILIDNDVVNESNINRQIIATHNTLGQKKTQAMKERLESINPDIRVETHDLFYLPDTADQVDLSSCDYIVDAVDTVTAKLEIIVRAKQMNIPVISSMGTGNKLDPTKLVVTDIYKTSVCPLAKVMRRELRKREISGLKVVYSTEEAITPEGGGRVPGSVAFVPSVAGLILAGEVVKDLISNE